MDGILPLWKPRGMTSHDCVFKIRKMLRTKKVGHTGTLDPEVSGVLPICVGRATKIAEYITAAGKVYEGEVTLGFTTTTEDAFGDKVEESKVNRKISRSEVLSVFEKLTGEIEQTPPMFSAVKVNGKRLYEYAREGKKVERPTRKVQIYELQLLEEWETKVGETVSFSFRVSCSKGTYIRTLAVQMGEMLGFPAHMSSLTRVKSASFTKENCFTLEEIQGKVDSNEKEDLLLPIEMGISYLPKIKISDTLAERVKNGARLQKFKDWPENSEVLMLHRDRAIAIYQEHPEKPGIIKPVKVLFND